MAKGFGTLKTNHDKKTKKSVALSPIKHPQGQNLLQLAIKAHKSGKLLQASNLCQDILAKQPDHIDAWLLLSNIYRQQNKLEKTIAAYQQLIKLQPNQVHFWNNLGVLYIQNGQPSKAIATFEQAIKVQPDYAETYSNLGELYREQDQLAAAEKHLQQAIKLKPNYPGAHYNLGNLYHNQDKIEQAIVAYQQAIKIQPDYANAHNNLGSMYHYQGDLERARDCYHQAIQLQPNYAIAYFNLGNVYKDQGKLTLALQAYHRATESQPDYSNAYINLGLVYRDCGQMEQSLKYLYHVSRFDPDHTVAHQNLLYYLHYSKQYSPEQIYQEHRRWAKHQQNLLPPEQTPYTNQPNSEKKIRLGYISGDFRTHSVAYFLEPILTQHNQEQFTLCCYAKNPCNDETTERFKQLADIWHDINRLDDEEVANLIRKDEIDILVDLSGHTGGNKLLALARKPAPVQVTYLGYPDTTGLDTIDYRFTDSFADPPGKTEQFHSEQLIRLPHGFLCYQPPADTPEVNSLPVLEKGYLTFGSFNNLAKISDRTISCWAKILHAVPHSRLILKTKPLQDEDICDRIYRSFEQEGIDRDRLTLLGWTATTEDHFRLYHQVDLALDTYPYHGTTTTCEAMWMGVPVITLAGQTHVSRVGVSLLSRVGLPELIANSEEEYISKAVSLSQNIPRLKQLRDSLRNKVNQSSLTDGQKITSDLEFAYRQMWLDWCKNQKSISANKVNTTKLKASIKDKKIISLQKALNCYLKGRLTQAELICRYLLREQYQIDEVYTLLGLICLSIEAYDFACQYFTHALKINPQQNMAKCNLHLAEKVQRSHQCQQSNSLVNKKEKFLLIKAWGYGFWSDVDHVLGQLLLAELTNRIPIVQWGDNSRYLDPENDNGFELYFQTVSEAKLDNLLNKDYTFYPSKWTEQNIHLNDLNKWQGSDSRLTGLYFLCRNEDVVVSDFHTYVSHLIPWIRPNHHLYNYNAQEIYRYLADKYLKLKPKIVKEIEDFWHNNLAKNKTIAVHVRGSDKVVENNNLPEINQKYHLAIESYLKQVPDSLIFLLTDDNSILEEYKKIYGHKLRYTNCVRTDSQLGLHYQKQKSHQKIGEEIIKDTYLAAKCDYFIGNGSSNVSTTILHLKDWQNNQYLLLEKNWLFENPNFSLYS